MHRFHCTGLHAPEVQLPADEAAHALRVLRLRDGDTVELVDGAGMEARGVLRIQGRHAVHATIGARRTAAAPATAVHLAVAPTKQAERFEWFVEKAVEVGVERITPLATARTERGHLRHERLMRVAVSAMKQSLRAWLPRIDPLTPLADLIAQPVPGQRFVAYVGGNPPPLMDTFDPAQDALVLVGPEGDWTDEELRILHERGFRTVGLGASRLRTETAALAACTWMSLARQRR